MTDRRIVAIFDGECGLCNDLRRWVQARDRRELIEFIPFQAAEFPARFPQLSREEAAKAMFAVDGDGRVFRGARAMAEVFRRLPGWKRVVGAIAAYPPVVWPGALVYWWVARNRHKLGSSECKVDEPPPATKPG
jgi:predicted DCC family thiol-disulfide oxidoreductase YuxK